MKCSLCLFILFFYCLDVHSQAKAGSSCAQYHKGNFIYVDSLGDVIRIKRKKKQQMEYNDKKNIWVSMNITWVSDCEYRLEQTHTNSKSRRKYNHRIVTILISKPMGAQGYEYSCSCGETMKTGTVTRVYK